MADGRVFLAGRSAVRVSTSAGARKRRLYVGDFEEYDVWPLGMARHGAQGHVAFIIREEWCSSE